MLSDKLNPKNAVVYVRVFNRESINTYSLNEQEAAITKYATENGYNILKVFREKNTPAKTFNRPVFTEMMNYINLNKWQVKFLFVSDLPRLSTDPEGLNRLRRYLKTNGIKLISIVQSLFKYCEKHTKQTH